MSPRSSGELFVWQGLSFEQSDDVFKIGTDALLLATWVPRIVRDVHAILDAGTGTGFLAIAMAAAYPDARVTGVDLNESSIALAHRNVARNALGDRIKCLRADVIAGLPAAPGTLDLVISNPPYFDRDVPSDARHDRLARHRAWEAEDWLRGCLRGFAGGGQLCVVVPFVDAFAWIRDANRLGWYVRNRLDVRAFDMDESPMRSLLHLTSRLSVTETKQIALYRAREEWHPEFLAWRDEAAPAGETT